MSLSQPGLASPSTFGGLLESRAIFNAADIKVQQHALPPPTRRNEWRFRPGSYTPRDFIREIALLLESVIVQLGPDGPEDANSRAILMDGLRSSLSHEGRETTLPLADWNSEQPSELTRHILRIGKALYQYASEANHIIPGDPSLTVYSPCEGHKWVPPAGRLLRSSRSSPILMMLYNEWLHQITCLRDILIGFDNFEDVILNLDHPSKRGTRPMEDIREALLAQVKTDQVSRGSFLEAAKVLTGPSLPAGGYGFQYNKGVVLPATVFSETSSDLLLHFSRTVLVQEETQRPVLFVPAPAAQDTKNLDVSELKSASSGKFSRHISVEDARNAVGEDGQYLIKLAAHSNGNPVFSVDVASVVRGLDAARNVNSEEEKEILASNAPSRVYEAAEVLLANASVVENKSSRPVVIRASEEVDLLALLGKLEVGSVRLGTEWKRVTEAHSSVNSESPRFLIIR